MGQAARLAEPSEPSEASYASGKPSYASGKTTAPGTVFAITRNPGPAHGIAPHFVTPGADIAVSALDGR